MIGMLADHDEIWAFALFVAALMLCRWTARKRPPELVSKFIYHCPSNDDDQEEKRPLDHG